MRHYPGNNDYPNSYEFVKVTVQSRSLDKVKREFKAYWSGVKWIPENGFKIGYAKVIWWTE